MGPRRTEALIERFGRFVFLKPALYQRMAEAYRRNHFWVTVVGQTVPAVRVYLSIPAGVLKLAILNFLGATLIGSMLWSGPLAHARICLARAKCGRRLFRSARRHGRGRAGVSWFARLAPGPSFKRSAIAAGLSPERGLISPSRPRHGQEASRGIKRHQEAYPRCAHRGMTKPGSAFACGLVRPDPVAVKTVGHAMAEMHQRDRTRLDIAGVEHSQIAAVLSRAPDRREQPAVAFGWPRRRARRTPARKWCRRRASRYLPSRFPLPSTWTMPDSAPNIGKSGLAQAYQP